MFKLGVATSIAKKQHYSWEYTVDFCARYNLNLIQFYWQNPIPLIKKLESLDIPLRFLHLPVEVDSAMNFPEFSSKICSDFSKFYKSNNLIVHQQTDQSNGVDDKLISRLNALHFRVGLENDYSKSLTGFKSKLKICQSKHFPIFVVFDIHKFFNRFYLRHSVEQILQASLELFLYCRKLNLTLILHIIDSKSFDSDRDSWCPLFEGILPYRHIFDLIKKYQISCEGIILEYEDEVMAEESIRRLREIII